jgi:translocation and assembly module TamB
MPQLSEEDQLSYLLTGSPAGQIGAAQAAFMLAAIGEASGSLGFSDTDAASLENITSNMGVDVSLAEGTRIDPETGEAISDTNVVVGSALSPKLYVSYSVGLLDPVNLFQVRYQLSRRFALQSVTTSEGDTGGDIIYGIETDGLPWKKRD